MPHLLQATGWLRSYQRRWLRADLAAGVTLAAYLIPASIGDAGLAGLPPQAGLYSCIFAGLVFWLFAGSRQTAVTVTSAISLMVGSSLGALAGGDAVRFGVLAAGTALIVALLAFLVWLARAGGIVNFISESVMAGFKFGVALYLTVTQLPKLCGFAGTHGDFWEQSRHFIAHAPLVNPASLAIGLGVLALLLLGKRYLPHRPLALPVLVVAILLTRFLDPARYGILTLGELPPIPPGLTIPLLTWADFNALLPLAMACFLLSAVETSAIGRMLAQQHGIPFNGNREFLALAAANFAAGLGRGYPVGGGMSQSLVNDGAGARTPLSGLFAAVLVLLATVFLAGFLQHLPLPVLAAIVIFAVSGLFKFAAFVRLWRFSRGEFAIAIAALLGVLCSGLLLGVLGGAIMSLLFLLRRGAAPHTTELGRVNDSDYFADLIRHPANTRIPGVFIFRADAPLLYYNADHIRARFFELLAKRPDPIRLVILFMGSVPAIDLAGAGLLTELRHTLLRQDTEFLLAETHGDVRTALRRAGFEKKYGPVEADQTVATVLRRWSARQQGPQPQLRTPQTTSQVP